MKRLILVVQVPASAPADTFELLRRESEERQGVTIVLPAGEQVDVDLREVFQR